ncbi:MAG: hypothetical protein HQM10_08300 [Candidatus Riflebacteria bacterium]|nr:hypothetical protein [Candidatus Riflebacteria bacterium]
MKRKKSIIFNVIAVIFFASLCASAYSLSPMTERSLEAFRRYEPDFSDGLRKLEGMDRKIKNEKISLESTQGVQITSDARDVYDFIQKRYDLLEDLYKMSQDSSPADRAALMDGFSRLDDLYRNCRDFFLNNFENREDEHQKVQEKPAQETKSEESKKQQETTPQEMSGEPATVSSAAQPIVPELPTTESAVSDNSLEKQSEKQVATDNATGTKTETATSAASVVPDLQLATDKKEKSSFGRAKISGTFKLDLRNRNEMYKSTDTVLPNNLRQSRLTLNYQNDAKNKFILDNKYLERERNELVKENVLTFNWLHSHSPKTSVALKDTLHYIWYPQNDQKDYRDNLAELFWNRKDGRYERLFNVGINTRAYPNYERSDFKQLNFQSQMTYFIQNGTLFSEWLENSRSYDNSSMLDYTGRLYDLEYNRSFEGNKSDISVSNTYEKRIYGSEAVNLFRTTYWDNYFRFRYDLPVSKTFTWVFEDEYQERGYPSDYLRGYSQKKLKTTAKVTIDKDTRGRLEHTYTYNSENMRAKAHVNNQYGVMLEKKYSKHFKVKFEDSYHKRGSVQGDALDFRENMIGLKPTWKINNRVDLSWKNEYLNRGYQAAVFPDFKYFISAIQASYNRPKKFDCQIEAGRRNFSYIDFDTASFDWTSKNQTVLLAKARYNLRKDLSLNFSASKEETFYRDFDPRSQELLWNFRQPMDITEFIGSLEYQF